MKTTRFIAALLVLGLSGCTISDLPRRGDAFYESGDFSSAAEIYARIAATHPERLDRDPDLAFRLSLSLLANDPSPGDIERARAILRSLRGDRSYRSHSRAVLVLLDRLEALDRQSRQQSEAAAACGDSLEECETTHQGHALLLVEEQRRRARAEAEIDLLLAQVEAMESSAAQLTRKIEALSNELFAIKRIDIQGSN